MLGLDFAFQFFGGRLVVEEPDFSAVFLAIFLDFIQDIAANLDAGRLGFYLFLHGVNIPPIPTASNFLGNYFPKVS